MVEYTKGNVTFLHIGDLSSGQMLGFYFNRVTKSLVPAIIDYFQICDFEKKENEHNPKNDSNISTVVES